MTSESLFSSLKYFFVFFFNDTATTEIYTLSLHDALPISPENQALIITVIKALKTIKAQKILIQILPKAASDIRSTILDALGSIGDSTVLPVLLKALAMEDLQEIGRAHV